MSSKSHLSAATLMAVLASAILAAEEGRPRVMHAEMVTAGDAKVGRSLKVADNHGTSVDASAPKPRMFDMPLIDKSKAEDPYKGTTAPVAAAPAAKAAKVAPAPVAAPAVVQKPAAAPAARPVLKLPELSAAQELTRQQREMMLATSGPRKAALPQQKVTQPVPLPVVEFNQVRWSYLGPGAPENWGKLRPEYAMCGTGKRQSPIDIRGGIRVDLDPIRFDYRPSHFSVVDNGHTVEVNVDEGSSISLTGRTYQLMQILFHRPAEERVNGRTFDMSAQLVHRDYENNTAIVTVLMDRGGENPIVQTIWNHMPLEVGMVVSPPAAALDLARLLPERREYFTYMGSLTTPPCTENVLWLVLREPVAISAEQIDIFSRLYPNNARPIQPTQGRLIKESR
jgi:carbonic anhydrase